MPATILIVEDEPAILELVAASLRRVGHRPVLAESAEQAQRQPAQAQGREPPPRPLRRACPGYGAADRRRRTPGRHHRTSRQRPEGRGTGKERILGLRHAAGRALRVRRV